MAATSTTQTEEHVSLKLLLNEKGNKVLLAEAGKDFVDILCSFLTMPLGTIAGLVEQESNIGPVTLGCLNSLHQSVADLDKSCFSNNTVKQMLLQPTNFAADYCNTLKLNIDGTQPTKYISCFHCSNYSDMTISTCKDNDICRCGSSRTFPLFLKRSPQGFVQDLLKCSLLSKSTLTDLFLGKKPTIGDSRFSAYDVELVTGYFQITLKLVIRKSDGKVLCAQGEQNFVNLLLSFLTFPLGGMARTFGEKCSLGSINQLYKSISELNENKYFTTKEAKNRLIDPCISPQFKLNNQFLPICQPGDVEYLYESTYVQCSKVGENPSYAGNFKKINFTYRVSPEGYVKAPAMYVATDDLVISPLSPISALGLLNRFKTPLNDLKEKVVTIGYKESLSILKAALTSTSALTNGLAHLLTEVKEEK
ncbi:uncharacterized protein LOC131614088 [Vicia villosa]|uniref:uncharacterized protein LOC131614088 n=1 Tax=Vicia villosa TaxID=3911 RepID=UPI00273C5515|nr:uncharacterized protein LOC131614088 [Vicia villosa]